MRQPLEDGIVTISRASGSLTFPARFMLIAASNPCPCGYLGHPVKQCTCAQRAVISYKKRLSGPILDRIDLHLFIPPVEQDKLMEAKVGEKSEVVKARVIEARERQKKRFEDSNITVNSEMNSKHAKKFCVMADGAENFLKQAIKKLNLSARSYFKIVKVARSIADLAGEDNIKQPHLAEALQYRSIE
jgi:magnesium chelatase family protein